MKGQFFELMVYPFMAIILLNFFVFNSKNLISETDAVKDLLERSDQAIQNSNEILLTCIPDHICINGTTDGTYFIRRLVLDSNTVKELIVGNER